jgi:uncharacterized protein (TIGR02001 family)
MNTLIKTTLGLALAASAATAAAADIAGNVTLASDYRFRGISQIEGGISPAIQGGFDFNHESGFYLGTWASNINFFGGSIETDVYGGFRGQFTEDVGYDVGVLYYGYPHATTGAGEENVQIDYYEVYGSVSFSGAKIGVNYSPDYFAETGDFFYPYIDYSYTFGEAVTLSAHLGYNSFDEESFLTLLDEEGNVISSDDSYLDWKLALSTTQLGVTWTLAYVDTDLDDDEECFGDEDLCAATAVFSISKSL